MVIRIPDGGARDLSNDPWITLAEAVSWAAWRGASEPKWGVEEFEGVGFVSYGDLQDEDRQVYVSGAEAVRMALAAGKLEAWAQKGYDEPVQLPKARWSGQVLGTVVSWVGFYHPFDRIIVERARVMAIWPAKALERKAAEGTARSISSPPNKSVTVGLTDDYERQWLRISKAVRILHRILKTRVAGQEPAPWIDPPADPFDAECENATHRHRRTARTSLTMRRALLSGDMTAHLVNGGDSHPLPGWAWQNSSAAENAFNFNWLPLNPLLEHGLQDFADWRCFVSRTEFKQWLARSEIMEIGDLPTLPVPFDQDTQPAQLSYREPPERPFVELTQALTWIAFSVSLSHDEFSFMESCRFGPFADAAWPASLRTALAKFVDQASAGKVRVRGRYVANYSDHSAASQANTEYLSDTQLRDFACFDSLYGGLEHGVGLTWEAQGLDRVLAGRRDGWREVEVSRENLLLAFRPKLDDTKAFFAPFPATLPGIGAVIPLYEALPWLVQGKPSHDIEVWQNAAGDLMLHDPSGAIIEPRADESPPSIIEIYRHASRTLHGALREGILPAYVAPASGVPLLVPRFYWNGVNSESLHHVYRGMTPDDHGAGCPVLLSRMTFDNWRTGIGTQHSARADHVSSILSSDPGRPNKRDEAIVLHSERVLDGSALPGKNAEAKAIEAILKRRHANDRGYEYKWASIARALRDYRDG